MGDIQIQASSSTAQLLAPWALNVSSSVVIVLVNKLLMGSQGYTFKFVVSLSGVHFLASGSAMHCMKVLGYLKDDKIVVTRELILLVVTQCLSVTLSNLSLMVNNIGFYQMVKLLVVPFVCFLEYIWSSKTFSVPIILSIAVVVLSVGIVTVSSITAGYVGFTIAMMSVVATGIQQTSCSSIQKKHSISSSGLLLKAGLPMGISMLLLGPIADKIITGQWLSSFEYSLPAIGLILLSSVIAIWVNLSVFMCLGRFSPVTYQVMSHIKTLLILFGGFLFFSENLSMKQMLGIISAVGGMVSYGYFTTRERK